MTRRLMMWAMAGLLTLGVASAQPGMGRRGNGMGQGPRDGSGFGMKAGKRGGNCGQNCVCDGTGRGRGAGRQAAPAGTMQRGRRR